MPSTIKDTHGVVTRSVHWSGEREELMVLGKHISEAAYTLGEENAARAAAAVLLNDRRLPTLYRAQLEVYLVTLEDEDEDAWPHLLLAEADVEILEQAMEVHALQDERVQGLRRQVIQYHAYYASKPSASKPSPPRPSSPMSNTSKALDHPGPAGLAAPPVEHQNRRDGMAFPMQKEESFVLSMTSSAVPKHGILEQFGSEKSSNNPRQQAARKSNSSSTTPGFSDKDRFHDFLQRGKSNYSPASKIVTKAAIANAQTSAEFAQSANSPLEDFKVVDEHREPGQKPKAKTKMPKSLRMKQSVQSFHQRSFKKDQSKSPKKKPHVQDVFSTQSGGGGIDGDHERVGGGLEGEGGEDEI